MKRIDMFEGERCSMCNRLYPTAELVPAHVPQLYNLDFVLEELIVCERCYSKLIRMACGRCSQIWYVTKEDLCESIEIQQIVDSGLCPKCYVQSLVKTINR